MENWRRSVIFPVIFVLSTSMLYAMDPPAGEPPSQDKGLTICVGAVVKSTFITVYGARVTDRSGVQSLFELEDGNHLSLVSTSGLGAEFLSLSTPWSASELHLQWFDPSGVKTANHSLRYADTIGRFSLRKTQQTSRDGVCSIFQGETRHPFVVYSKGTKPIVDYLSPDDLNTEPTTASLLVGTRWDSKLRKPVAETVGVDEIFTVAALLFDEPGPVHHILTITNFGDVAIWDDHTGSFKAPHVNVGIARPYKGFVPTVGALLGGNGPLEITSADRTGNVVSAALSPDNRKLVVGFSPGFVAQFSIPNGSYYPNDFPDSRNFGNSVAIETSSLNHYFLPRILGFLQDPLNAVFVGGSEPVGGQHPIEPGWGAPVRPAFGHSSVMIYQRPSEQENLELKEIWYDHPGASIREVFFVPGRVVTITDDPDSKIRLFKYDATEQDSELMATVRIKEKVRPLGGSSGANGPLAAISAAILSVDREALFIGTDSGLLLVMRLSDGKVTVTKRVNHFNEWEGVTALLASKDGKFLFIQTIKAMYRIKLSDLK